MIVVKKIELNVPISSFLWFFFSLSVTIKVNLNISKKKIK